MNWVPLPGAKNANADLPALPGKRGRFLLYLAEPILEDGHRWVHFSWVGESFAIRDYLKGRMMRQESGLTASAIWLAARKRLPATGAYYHSASDIDWWIKELKRLEKLQ
jgi:hypothetical protein